MSLMTKPIKIRNKEILIPIVQGGMGVGISLSSLASTVINEGGIGTISAAQLGFEKENFWRNARLSFKENRKALKEEILKVRHQTSDKGFLAVNILTAARDYKELALSAVEAGADAIVSGAGLPIDLPKYTAGSNTANIPIVANSRVLNIISRKWHRKYNVLPDAVVVEGPMAGGHLGIKYEEIGKEVEVDTLEDRLADVLNYRAKNNLEYPVFVAGGVFTHEDVKRFIEPGAEGVQLGTRFIATHECDADIKFKEKFIEAKKEDILYVKNPVGYPARAIANNLTTRLESGHIMPDKCIGCVLPCKGLHESTLYCISEYLVKAVKGDAENGLVFTGENGYRVSEIVSVKQLINELLGADNE